MAKFGLVLFFCIVWFFTAAGLYALFAEPDTSISILFIMSFFVAAGITYAWDRLDTWWINNRMQNSKKRLASVSHVIEPPKSKEDLIREKAKEIHDHLHDRATHSPILAVYIGGSGYPLDASTAYYLACLDNSLAICNAVADSEIQIPFASLTSIEVSGPGTEKSNAGLIGGGFGIEGAVKGIVAAALINAATTRSSTNTFLRIATGSGEAHFHFNNIEPSALRLTFSKLFVAAENSKANASGLSLAQEIKQLQTLKEEGALTEEEFTTAKEKLLKR